MGDPGPDLVARQPPPFAGLGTLRHLDLEFVSAHQVFTRDTKAARCDLLDGAATAVAVGVGSITPGVFTPFTGVALAPQTVHGDGQSLLGPRADGAVRHRTRGEAFDDRGDRLDLLDAHGLA